MERPLKRRVGVEPSASPTTSSRGKPVGTASSPRGSGGLCADPPTLPLCAPSPAGGPPKAHSQAPEAQYCRVLAGPRAPPPTLDSRGHRRDAGD